jgi:hypothetical protein
MVQLRLILKIFSNRMLQAQTNQNEDGTNQNVVQTKRLGYDAIRMDVSPTQPAHSILTKY